MAAGLSRMNSTAIRQASGGGSGPRGPHPPPSPELLVPDWDRDPHLRVLNFVFAVCLIGSVTIVAWIWAFKRRNLQPLRSRSAVLLIGQTVAAMIMFAEGITRQVLDGKILCDLHMVTQVLNLAAVFAPSATSAYRVCASLLSSPRCIFILTHRCHTGVLRKLQRMVSKGFDGVDLEVVKKLRWRTSWRLPAIVFGSLLFVGLLLVWLRVAVLRPNYYFRSDGPVISDCSACQPFLCLTCRCRTVRRLHLTPSPSVAVAVAVREEYAVLLCWLGLQITAYYGIMCKLRGLSEDFYYHLREMRLLFGFSVPFFLTFAVLFTGRMREVGTRYFPPYIVGAMWATTIVVISVLTPAILTHQKDIQLPRRGGQMISERSEFASPAHSRRMSTSSVLSGSNSPLHSGSVRLTPAETRAKRRALAAVTEAFSVGGREDLSLKTVLWWPPARELFAEHLEREFSAESLMFWRLANPSRIAADARAMGISVRDRQEWLARTFLLDGAPMQVNVPAEVCANAANVFDKPNAVLSVPKRSAVSPLPLQHSAVFKLLFSQARRQVYLLMLTDSWPRFRTSPAYEAVLELARGLISRGPAAPYMVAVDSVTEGSAHDGISSSDDDSGVRDGTIGMTMGNGAGAFAASPE